ncbi:MAG: rod shape-determining protein RodA [Patescibacteria group bacterium]|nr:MAG: rod shape-determining protein RodA [Patescibacteria group bacterium]
MANIIIIFFISALGIINLIGIQTYYAYRQLIFLLLGLVVYLLTKKFNLLLKQITPVIFWLIWLLNLSLLFFGEEIKGAKRWISLGFFNLQPSEFLIIFYIFYISLLFNKDDLELKPVIYFLHGLGITAVSFIVIFLQPDFTTATNLIPIFITALFFSKIPKKIIISAVLVSTLSFPVLWGSLKDYQKNRIIHFFSAFNESTSEKSYNSKQAEIALGSGRFIGKGIGRSTQSKLFFLPESHTDFAFASFVEQTGLIGGVFLIILYAIFIYNLIFSVIKKGNIGQLSSYIGLTHLCLAVYLSYRVIINIAMNLNLFPIAGIPLPLFSYGGSAFIALLLSIGLLELKE